MRIFLEECFMRNRLSKIIDHQLEYWQDLRLGVPGVMRECGVLSSSAEKHKHYGLQHTHSRFSSINRAKYIDAAAT